MIHSLLKNQFTAIVNANLEPDSVVNQIFRYVVYYPGFNLDPEIPLNGFLSPDDGLSKISINGLPDIEFDEKDARESFRLNPVTNKGKGFWGRDATEEDFTKAAHDFIKSVNDSAAEKVFPLIMTALKNARTEDRPHLIPAVEDGKFSIDDINRLKVLHKRLNQSWAKGYISNEGLTDLFVPHHILEEIRGWNYSAFKSSSDELIKSAFTGNIKSVWDIEVHEIPFDAIFAIDRNAQAFWRIMKKKGENVTSLEAYQSEDEIGFEGDSEESWAIVNNKAIVGLG